MAEAIQVERPKLGLQVSRTNELRILRRSTGRALQQKWVIVDLDHPKGGPEAATVEWRDVPTVDEGGGGG